MNNKSKRKGIATDFETRLTELGKKALGVLPADEVAPGMMAAALNIALEVLPHTDVAQWLRRLAETIEQHDEAAPSRLH